MIIVAGPAGANAALEIRNRDKEKSVLLLSSEREYPYNRVPLSKEYLRGSLAREKLFLKNARYYEDNGIKLVLGRSVTRIDPKKRSVTLDDGSECQFETLLNVAGGSLRKLDIEGSTLSGIHYLPPIWGLRQDKRGCFSFKTVSGNRKRFHGLRCRFFAFFDGS